MLNSERSPIIAIVTNSHLEDDDNSHISYICRDYFLWLKELGAIPVILLWNLDREKTAKIISKVNGVLFQGGDRTLRRDGLYEKNLSIIMEECNKQKKPIWFTCQGIQYLHCLLTENFDLLGRYKARGVLLSNQLKSSDVIATSKMFGHFSENDIKICNTQESFVHYNNFGVSESRYNEYPVLQETLTILATASDCEGNVFISAVESKDFSKSKYFAVQSHPEKAKYSTNIKNCTEYTASINSLIGKGFILEATKTFNDQKEEFKKEELEKILIKDDFAYHLDKINEKFFFDDGEIMKEIELKY